VLTQAILSLAFCNWVNGLVMAPWCGWVTGLSRDISRSPALFGRQGVGAGMEQSIGAWKAFSSFRNNV
jgi:hypothetical protein